MSLTTDICLVLFCRRPAPGVGKQRLAAAIGPAAAARAGEHLLATAVEDLEHWPGPVALAPASAADRDWAGELSARDCPVIPQPDGNLGERLNAIDRALRAAGQARLLFIGSDAPELTVADYATARAAMEKSDVVLGEAQDGGVTLMGTNQPWPPLASLPWSTARLAGELADLCRQHGHRVEIFAAGADVDLVADLERVATTLATDQRPARQRLVHWWQSEGRRSAAGS